MLTALGSICLLFCIFIVGRVLKFRKISIIQEEAKDVFENTFNGYIVTTACYAIFNTNFKTILLPSCLAIILLSCWQFKKKGDSETWRF